MASTTSFRLNQRVTIAGKGAGTIAFVGKTEFADGDWIGIILDEPKGKNNGTVQKKDGTAVRYFSCNENYGLYVRPAQIESVLNESQMNLSRSASTQSVKSQNSSTGSLSTPSTAKSSGLPTKQPTLRAPSASRSSRPASGLPRAAQSSHDIPATTPTPEKTTPPKEEIKPAPAPTPVVPPPIIPPPPPVPQPKVITEKPTSPTSDSAESQKLLVSLKSKVTDQEEQIQTLIKKRRDDLEKLKEFERTKLQLDQLQTYRREAQERIKELNEKLQHEQNELKATRDKYTAYQEEMNDTEVRIESLALDLEMAEEKLETVTSENGTLKEKLEEVQLELDIIKGEIQLNGTAQVATGIQKRIDDERTMKLEQALIKLRDLSLSKQAENETLKKHSETLEHKLKVLAKENEHVKNDMVATQATIADLKEQVDTCLGAQQMVDILTTKNLSLEDQVRELQETVDNLESLCEMDKEMEENAKEVEHDLRQSLDLLQNQMREKERQIERLQYTIGDHERTILKFRETFRNLQQRNEQSQKQIDKYGEQLKLAGSAQSSEFKAKIVETKSYGEMLEGELKKIEAMNLSRHVNLLTLFLPEQWMKRGADHDCILLVLLVQRLISKCDLLINEIEKKFERIHPLTIDDVMKSHRAEQWSFACKLSQSICIFRMNLRKHLKALEVCQPATLRRVASAYHDLVAHEKPLDFLIDLLQKDQLHDTVSLNALTKTILFYEHIYKSYLSEEKFSMSTYLQDLSRVVTLSSDSLQTDIQRLQMLQKAGNDQSPFTALVKRLIDSNEQMHAQATKINRLALQDNETHHLLLLNTDTLSSIESVVRNLDRLAKTFHEICSGLTTQILMLTDANERISVQEIESIAYQACDKVYKKEDRGPYESLWDSMHETLTILTNISQSLEAGAFDSHSVEQNDKLLPSKQAIYLIAEQLKTAMNESEMIRARVELKDEELLDLKKMLKIKHDELSELNIRLSLNEKRIDSQQREFDEKGNKHKQMLEEARIDAQKKIKQCEEAMAVLQNDNEQLEQEKSALKERLKQLTKSKLVDDLMQKKTTGAQRISDLLSPTMDGSSSNLRQASSPFPTDGMFGSVANAQEVEALQNTVRLLKDELWHLKMSQSSGELAKLQFPLKEKKTSEIADIYKDSTLLLNDLFSTIANYKITGENVAAKQHIVRSKMKLVDQTASDLSNRLNQCQNERLPGSSISTPMKTFLNPQFSKALMQERQLAAEIHLPGVKRGGGAELDISQEQYRAIMREAIGCS